MAVEDDEALDEAISNTSLMAAVPGEVRVSLKKLFEPGRHWQLAVARVYGEKKSSRGNQSHSKWLFLLRRLKRATAGESRCSSNLRAHRFEMLLSILLCSLLLMTSKLSLEILGRSLGDRRPNPCSCPQFLCQWPNALFCGEPICAIARLGKTDRTSKVRT